MDFRISAQNRVGLCKSSLHTFAQQYKCAIQERGESEIMGGR